MNNTLSALGLVGDDCTNSIETYIAIGLGLLFAISEGMGATKGSKFNGLLHVFSSQCFQKKRQDDQDATAPSAA